MIKIHSDSGQVYTISLEGENFFINDKIVSLDQVLIGKGKYHIIYNNKNYHVEVINEGDSGDDLIVNVNGNTYSFRKEEKSDYLSSILGIKKGAGTQLKEIKAPMPGLIIDVMVKEGQEVVEGDALLILEAMKMENVIKSPVTGTITKVFIEKGQGVEKGMALIEF